MVSVIILNYNGMNHRYLPSCLESLMCQTYSATQLIVVDNASKDDSAAFVAAHYPQVKWVQNRENLGFCTGNNEGYRYAKGEYVLFANNDTYFHPNCLERLVAAVQSWPMVGMVAPKLVRPFSNLLDSAGLQLRADFTLQDRGFSEPDYGQFEQPVLLFAPCGAAAFYRREVLEMLRQRDGMVWDENFFAYYEDGDLAWRAQNLGWQCLYCPTAVVEHHRGGSSPATFFNKPPLFQMHTLKNRYLMLVKNASTRLIVRKLFHLLWREATVWGYLCLHPRLLVQLVRVLHCTLPIALRQRHTGPIDVFTCEAVDEK